MPSSVHSCSWRDTMADSTSSCSPASAVDSSFSRRSVMPLTAECTTSTFAPSAPRFFAMAAMLFQLGRFETLVPPNFSTIQRGCRVVMASPAPRRDQWNGASRSGLVVVVVGQVALQLALGKHFLELAPRRLAALPGLVARALLHPVQQALIVAGVFLLGQELVVDIESVGVAFGHLGNALFVR